MKIKYIKENLTGFTTERIGDSECIVTDEYAIVPLNLYNKLKNMSAGTSAGGKNSWKNVSKEERSRIARERGIAGAAKRWNKK